ncbi:MAG: helix-turn-helix transcriptional regulator [Coriobacteriales bacterium]|jgi:DNA-binding CsgD family transcriptional regulator
MGDDALSIAIVGVASYWALVIVIAFCPTLLPEASAGAGWLVWVLTTVAHGTVACAFAGPLRRRASLRVVRTLVGIAPALAVGGMVGILLPDAPGAPWPLYAGSLLVGAGTALLFLGWARVLLREPAPSLAWALSSRSQLLGLGISALVTALPALVGKAVVLALPVLSAVCIRRSLARPQGQVPAREADDAGTSTATPPPDPSASAAPAPVGMLVCCVLFCIPMSVLRTEPNDFIGLPASSWPAMLSLVTLTVGAIIVVDMLSSTLRRSHFFYRLIVPLLAGGMLLFSLLFSGDGVLAGTLVLTATGLFLVYAYYAVSCLFTDDGPSSLRGVAMVAVAIDAGMVLGALVGSAVRDATASLAIETVLGIAYLALLTGMQLLPRSFEWLSAFDRIERSESSRARRASSETRSSTILERCDDMTRSYGLSERESQVLQLLVRGRGVRTIARELCLSENTVKTHKSHLYTKLDVHTREELVALFESTAAPEARDHGDR